MQKQLGNIWVCIDCMLTEEQDGKPDDFDGDREPWELWDNPNCTLTPNWDSDTEEGMATFSWSPCEGCGSILGGSRWRYMVWGD
jgi:hypothetical protein